MSKFVFCVFIHDQRFHKYSVYYSDKRYVENMLDNPSKDCDAFEYCKLTKEKIRDEKEQGNTVKQLLKAYCKNIKRYRKEICNCTSLTKQYDFFEQIMKKDGNVFHNTNESNILRFFNMYSSKLHKPCNWDKITWSEYLWYEKPYNGQIMKYKTGKYDCIGYDFSMSFPTILASQTILFNEVQEFYFPIKCGVEGNFKVLPKYPEMGIYRVKIECDNEDFLFLFNNKNNTYTHLDIIFCRQYQKQFNIKMTIINDDKPNVLLYEGWKSRINGKHVFKPWYDRICDLKKELPTNGLIKMLSSSIWGYLSKINSRYYRDEELDEKNIEFDYDDDINLNYLCLNEKENTDGETDYKLIDKRQPYCKNYRLKPFITAFQRILISKIAITIGIKKIVRINTDCIVFDKKLLTSEDLIMLNNISPTFIKEDKTTGLFNIQNIKMKDRIDEL